jgi:hypothetical protein
VLGDVKNNLAWKPGPGYWFAKGKVMKNVSVLTILGVLLCALALWLGGCGYFAQPGETLAEGHRRHLRNLSINQLNLMRDVDRALLIDEPSKLSSRRID